MLGLPIKEIQDHVGGARFIRRCGRTRWAVGGTCNPQMASLSQALSCPSFDRWKLWDDSVILLQLLCRTLVSAKRDFLRHLGSRNDRDCLWPSETVMLTDRLRIRFPETDPQGWRKPSLASNPLTYKELVTDTFSAARQSLSSCA